MPADMGIELFYEFGSEEMWFELMSRLRERGVTSMSIHAPFSFVDMAADTDEHKLFETLKRPFDLYHRFGGEFYVVHAYGDKAVSGYGGLAEDCRKRTTERFAHFQDVCRADGVLLGVENLCSGSASLFNQQQFLKLFDDIPQLNCVLDVGHAIISGMDVHQIQKTLQERICAYHLHNNDGKKDIHSRLDRGVYSWEKFARSCAAYTPNTVGVLEYMDVPVLSAYIEDSEYIEKLIKLH